MIKINVSRTCAETTQRERLTSGMQGAEVSFFFSADWDGLVKTAVFEGGGQSVDVLLTGAHDMYHSGEYALLGGKLYLCVQDTAYSPADYAAAWEKVTA